MNKSLVKNIARLHGYSMYRHFLRQSQYWPEQKRDGYILRSMRQTLILAGDLIDVAFTLELNDHPEYGGLELRLLDVVKIAAAEAAGAPS